MGVFIVIFAGVIGTVSALVALVGFGVGLAGAIATYFATAGVFMLWGLSRPTPVMRHMTKEEQFEAWQRELGFQVNAENKEEISDDDTRAA